jgi:hypothetical protein
MNKKLIIKRIEQINTRRHLIIRELDSLDTELNNLLEIVKSKKLISITTVEVQKDMQVLL